jgi:Flp pilus assembly protein TadD
LLEKNREFDSSADEYLSLIRYQPGNDALHNDLGNVYMDLGRETEAISEFNAALTLNPKFSSAHHNFGLCLLRKDNLDEAIAEFRRALELNPREPYTPVFLGVALGKKGDWSSARDQFQRYMAENQKDASAHAHLAYALDQMKDTSGAIKELRTALELQPNYPEAENDLAWIYATTRDDAYRNPKLALELARNAVRDAAAPTPAFLDTLAEALFVNGDSAEAVKTEEQALLLDPGNSQLRARLNRFKPAR